jgi:hypothetical protein
MLFETSRNITHVYGHNDLPPTLLLSGSADSSFFRVSMLARQHFLTIGFQHAA